MSSLQSFTQKFGRISDIDSGDTNEDIWDGEGAYGGFLAAATEMTISSSSADDTAEGTGAQSVKVFYLDSNWNKQSATIDMNGQSASATTITAIRVFRAYAVGVGSGGSNAGDIWIGSGALTAGVPANKYAGILTGNGQTLMAVYSISADATEGAKVTRWYVTGTGTSQSAYANVALQTREFGEAWRTRRVIDIAQGGTLDQSLTFTDEDGNRWGGVDLGAKADIRVRIVANGVNSSSFSAGFDVEEYS